MAYQAFMPQTQSLKSMERNESRKEPRYPTNDKVRVFLLPCRKEQPAAILNVSKSGVQLELTASLPPQATIEILASDGLAIFGEVRYCRPAGTVYHAGVHIHDTIFTPRPGHIPEDSLLLYTKAHGLSAHDRIRIGAT